MAAALQPVFRDSEEGFRRLAEALPTPIYTVDPSGRITFYNEAAATFWGHRPPLGTAYWCGSWKLYWPDGTPLPHDQCPVVLALRERRPIRDVEAIAERPNGERAAFVAYPTPLFDSSGTLIGGFNMLIDVSDRKKVESVLSRQSERLESLNRIAKTLTSDLDLERIVQAATDGATELSGARFGAFFHNVDDEKGERYVLYTLSGASREAFSKLGLPRNTAIFEPTFRGQGTVRSDDIRKDPRYGHTAPHHGMPQGHLLVVSYLAVPVVSRSGKVHGGLFFGHEEAGVFTAEAEEIVEAIAAQTAVAIDNANLLRDAQREIAQRRKTEETLAQCVAEQAALYRFTDRTHRARSLPEIHEAALEAICDALNCERASILLFDGDGVMRFIAWRGLSDSYRAAVEGHSPWTADARDPEPITVSDAAAADLPDALRTTLEKEGIRSLAFIPLVVNDRLIGKFMTYYSEPHGFGETEIALSVAIARQLAFSVARMRAETERREIEGALRAKDAELETILARTPFMMVRCDSAMRYRFASPAWLQLVGQSADEVIGRPMREVLGDEAFEVQRPHLERALAGHPVEWESEILLRGEPRVLRGVYQPEQDSDGRVKGCIGSLLDVTDRRRADDAARRLASIVESSDDAIVSKDLNGIVTSWNSGAERIFGYSAEEMIGRPILTVIPEDRHEEEPDILSRLRNGERVDHFETVRRRKDGRLIDVSLTISPLRDAEGHIVGASKIARDISDRKRAEASLRNSEHRLQELLAAIPAAIYTTDAEGTITYFNEAAVAFAGHRPRVGIDKWCVSWKLFWPDGTPLPHDQCPMAIALREGRIVRNVEAIAERPDGSRVPFIPFPTPLRDGSGRIVGGINMLVDISERKQSETHQRVLLRELNHRVKNNMQILHVLLNSSRRASKSPEARSILEDASRRVGAMAAAQQVLYGTQSGMSFQADAFLQSVCRMAQDTFGRNVRIVIERAQGTLSNDAAMPMALILNEFITNAVKYALPHDGGEIRVGLVAANKEVMLYVEDDGPGFDFQAAVQRSSGLGLVQALARQLKGQVDVTRTHCTRCIVRFPQASDVPA